MLRLRVGCAFGALLLVAGCVAPARDISDYRYKATLALDDAHSSLEAAGLSIGLLDTRDLPMAPVEVLIRQSEDTISGAESLFASVKPPTAEAEGLRDRVIDLLDQAFDPVEEARIALQTGDRAAAVDAMADAGTISRKLKEKSDELTAANEKAS